MWSGEVRGREVDIGRREGRVRRSGICRLWSVEKDQNRLLASQRRQSVGYQLQTVTQVTQLDRHQYKGPAPTSQHVSFRRLGLLFADRWGGILEMDCGRKVKGVRTKMTLQ